MANVQLRVRAWQDAQGVTYSHSASADNLFQSLSQDEVGVIQRHFSEHPPVDGYRHYDINLSQSKIFSCNIHARVVDVTAANGAIIPQRTCTLKKVSMKD
ncbi:MAG: hypothetical protein LBJ94_01640 [Puniceicoccales bacterium]|jgi:hypothetical protein|nr:hypothetical protein [Puniceicoccales bacterium]